MEQIVQTQQPWQPLTQNMAGIRRLKLTDARACLILEQGVPTGSPNIPVGHFIPLVNPLLWYEFIFPTDQACGIQIVQQQSGTGQDYYVQTLSFSLPQFSKIVTAWQYATVGSPWLAVAEDWNGGVYLLGHPDRGLVRSFQGGTGANARDRNQQSFAFTSQQLVPYYGIAAYEDSVLFPAAGFTYGFSLGFRA